MGVLRLPLLDNLATLQRHPDYQNAKAGSHHAAFRLIADLAAPKLKTGVGAFPEHANFIIQGGGNVVGHCVMVDDGRIHTLIPDRKTIRSLEERFGNEIKDIFGISVACLTANEAQYLIGFRSADEIRGRCAKAKEEIHRRRLAKSGH